MRLRLIDADLAQEVLRSAEETGYDQRLSKTLCSMGESDALCERIDAEGASLAEALERLSLGSHENASDSHVDFETLMEGTSQNAPVSDRSPVTFASGKIADGITGNSGSGRYLKQQPHARGGLGQVWVARDSELRRVVALKEVQPAFAEDEACRARFVREAEITGALQHPGIVPVYGLGRDVLGRPFYAMRFIEGKNLREAIGELFADSAAPNYRDGKWSLKLRRILGNFVDVCNTLEYAHSMRVIHRDIKPSNIMIGDYGETLLVDWGLAKSIADDEIDESQPQQPVAESSELTHFGAVVGTPAYMSPEQAEGGVLHPVGIASDVFSLGATLFHVLVGSPPVGHSDAKVSPVAMREAASQISPLDRRTDVPKPLVSICRKAMSVDPSQRYAGAKQLATDIEAWMADQPVSSHQETRSEKLLRWMRVHPTLVATSSACLLLLLVACTAGVLLRSSFKAELWKEQQQAAQAAKSYLQDLQSSADAAEASAMTELRNSQYSAALKFLQRAEELLVDVPELESELTPIANRRIRTQRLVDFYRDLTLAEDLTFDEHSRRSTILFQRALKQIGVFQNLEWWNNLPDEDLDAQQRHKLREDVYRSLYLLAALRLKETLPSEYTIQAFLQFSGQNSEEANAASIVLFDLMDGYRASQGSRLGRQFAEDRTQVLQKVVQGIVMRTKAIDWNAKNAVDSYVMGSALSFFCLEVDPKARKPFEAVLGLVDAEKTSLKMLNQSADLQPSYYFSQMMLGQTQRDHQQFEASYLRYTHAIAIRPTYAAGYYCRGEMQLEHSQTLKEDDPLRQVLFRRAQRDLEKAIDLNPKDWYSYQTLGDALSWTMEDTREVVPWYRQALALAEPLPRLRDLGVESTARATIGSIRNWLKTVAENSEDRPEAAACAAWAALMLGDPGEAKVLLALSRRSEVRASGTESGLGDEYSEEYQGHVAQLVDCLLKIGAGDSKSAMEPLIELCDRAAEFFHAHAALADCYESRDEFDLAYKTRLLTLKLARTDWQKMECYTALCRCSAELRRGDTTDWIRKAIQLDSTDDLDSLRSFLLERQGTSDAVQAIDIHQESLKPIQTLTDHSPPKHPAIINGDFELGLTEAWGNALEKIDSPAWQRTGASLAVARVEPLGIGGSAGLRVINTSRRLQGRSAQLTQTFPVSENLTYELSLEMRVISGASGAVEIQVLDTDSSDVPLCKVESREVSDWRTLRCHFSPTSPSATLSIRCIDICDIIIDSVDIVAID
ncbi:MAG TPA: hypothetical protein DDW52_22480 [Planctomycetaceae bacterium]|nr:hypothetical protein [Planctomycetaceae bacterium]